MRFYVGANKRVKICSQYLSDMICCKLETVETMTSNLLHILLHILRWENGTALTEAMSEHPRVTYEDGGHPVSVDTSRVVFLLVSDIGAERVNTAVLKFRNRSDVLPVS